MNSPVAELSQTSINGDVRLNPGGLGRGQWGVRTAIGELVVLKVEERASTALVTYASDGLSLGDVVERR